MPVSTGHTKQHSEDSAGRRFCITIQNELGVLHGILFNRLAFCSMRGAV